MRNKITFRKEHQIIQSLSRQILKIVNANFGEKLETKIKSRPFDFDIVTSLDLKLERLILKELKRRFPADNILSEENGYSGRKKFGRTWYIDPLCGTVNASRGIKFFSTNFALAVNGEIRAAWVVDHNRGCLIWSVGGLRVHVGNRRLKTAKSIPNFTIVNLDRGYFGELDKKIRARTAKLVQSLLLERKVDFFCFNSSLSFAYVATGQIQGSLVFNVKVWDFAAASFLIEQAGGYVTNFDGGKWGISSRSLNMASDKSTHRYLAGLIRKHNLQNLK